MCCLPGDPHIPLRGLSRTETWRLAHEAGLASKLCDHIVTNNPVPHALLVALQVPGLNDDPRKPTAAQMIVLQHRSDGLKNTEIAVLMGKSLYTINKHATMVLERMHTRTVSESVAICLRKHWINYPSPPPPK